MRAELDEIEKIELYLSGEMNPEEVKIFEDILAVDAALGERVDEQKTVLEGIRKRRFREAADVVFKRYKIFKKLKWSILGLAILTLIIYMLFLVKGRDHSIVPTTTDPQSKTEEFQSSASNNVNNDDQEKDELNQAAVSHQHENASASHINSEEKGLLPENKKEDNTIAVKESPGEWKGTYEITDKVKFMGVMSNSGEGGEITLLNTGFIQTAVEALNGRHWEFDSAKANIVIENTTSPLTWVEKDKSFTFKMKYEKRNYKFTLSSDAAKGEE